MLLIGPRCPGWVWVVWRRVTEVGREAGRSLGQAVGETGGSIGQRRRNEFEISRWCVVEHRRSGEEVVSGTREHASVRAAEFVVPVQIHVSVGHGVSNIESVGSVDSRDIVMHGKGAERADGGVLGRLMSAWRETRLLWLCSACRMVAR